MTTGPTSGPPREVRAFGAMEIVLERRGSTSVDVTIRLSTLLVDVAILSPSFANWRFDALAGGASARGALTLTIEAPGAYSTVRGDLEYTANGTPNRYRGLLMYWEAQAEATDVPLLARLDARRKDPQSRTGDA